MTEHKSFKRLVRARMEKTGESYTTARARLLRADEPAVAAAVGLAGKPAADVFAEVRERKNRF